MIQFSIEELRLIQTILSAAQLSGPPEALRAALALHDSVLRKIEEALESIERGGRRESGDRVKRASPHYADSSKGT